MTEDDPRSDHREGDHREGGHREEADREGAAPAPPPRPAHDGLPDHAVRRALLDLLAEVGTVTATEAAGRLGYSSGLCSFHLRQLARYGRIEEAPHRGGRARPWRMRQAPPPSGGGFGELARGLEDESYRRWLARRERAPRQWRGDEAFSAVLYLTPQEVGEVADAVRQVLDRYRDREQRPAARPAGAGPVAVIARLFPLLPEDGAGGG